MVLNLSHQSQWSQLMISAPQITTPDDPHLDELCERLVQLADRLDAEPRWPAEQLELCATYGVFRWFIERRWGGVEWNETDILRGYLKLSAACLTTTFIITQYTGACRRLADAEHLSAAERLLPKLAAGEIFATLGISHLTTSRRHLSRPVMRASASNDGFVLDGFTPWVTGAPAADYVVTGATLEDGRQILIMLPTDLAGVEVPEPPALVGLSASMTGKIECRQVEVDSSWLLSGPVENVMQQGGGGATGGLQTSTLAVGLADAAIRFISAEAQKRPDLQAAADALRADWRVLHDQLVQLADGQAACSKEDLRSRANSLVLRAAQAALTAAKGSGYVIGHPAGRWCREALFFLVWSCPQPVMAANLCELAGIDE